MKGAALRHRIQTSARIARSRFVEVAKAIPRWGNLPTVSRDSGASHQMTMFVLMKSEETRGPSQVDR